MRLLFVKNFLLLLVGILVVVAIAVFGIYIAQNTQTSSTSETATVSRGDVMHVVTVSGKVEAKNIATLSFPTTGTVHNVYKNEGDIVTQGDILASLTQDSVVNDYNAMVQNLKFLESSRAELIRGPENAKRTVTNTNVQIAEQDVYRTEQEQALIVRNARETLLSSELEAVPTNPTNNDTPPTITGNYLCTDEGTYTLSVFNSKSPTGYSYFLTGLEEGSYTAYTDVQKPIGTCGLYIQFDSEENYKNAEWTIAIPNTRSASYLTNLNAYRLALQQQSNAVAAAKQALELARHTEQSLNDKPSKEALEKIDATIAQTRSLLSVKEAQIADYTIRAPFNGTITQNNIKIGETASQDRNMTILQEGEYELKARIPEVDITDIRQGVEALVSFDAKPDEAVKGTIGYISSNATQIDGVAYYEATIILSNKPSWIREGLNADIQILIAQKKNVTRLPERFVLYESGKSYVLSSSVVGATKTALTTGTRGNDGYIEVTNLAEGTTVVLP